VRWHRTKGSLALPFVVFALLSGAVLVGGCADVTGNAVDQDIAQLRQDVNALKVAVQRGRGDAEAMSQLDRRTKEQLADNARQMSALSSRLEAMSQELGRVSSRLDDLSRRVEAQNRPAPPVAVPPAPLGLSPSTRPPTAPAPSSPVNPIAPGPPSPLSPPVARGTTPTPLPPPPSGTSPVPSPPAPSANAPAIRPPSGGPGAEESYQAAYLDFTRGRYELAVTGFREFLRRFPDSPLADSAQYGIGESYYSMATAASDQGQTEKATRALEQAVQEFRKVSVAYPRGAKVPTAIYKEALALAELKQTALAQSRLQYLLDHFPQSEEAPLARERLAALRQ